jgi:ubiquinone/menaquinone biosynthesis C-methylase UbiE
MNVAAKPSQRREAGRGQAITSGPEGGRGVAETETEESGGAAAVGGHGRADNWSQVRDSDRVVQAAAKLARLSASPPEMKLRERYLELLVAKSGEIIVDVGAGSGVITSEIARRVAPGGRVFAIDPSAGLLDVARATTREAGIGHLVDFRVADGRDLPFGLSAFDAAFCRWVLMHVDGPEKIIAEMRRVTRRGGRVVSVEADWETAMVHPGDREITRRVLNNAADRQVDPWIARRLPALFASQGFAEVDVETIVATDQGGGDRAWLEYLYERAALAVAAGVVTREEAVRWMAALDEGFNNNNFLFGVTQFIVVGRVPR